MNPPPTRMRLSDVPAYVMERTGTTVSRQTVYNWAKTGKQGVVLKTTKHIQTLFTTKGWVDDFLAGTHR